MGTTKRYLFDLSLRGYIEGLTLTSKSTGEEICHYFGGIPYALPPIGPFRWRRPRPLPACYRYGTKANPGNFTGGASPCPQPRMAKTTREEELREEDCLQLNVWLPRGDPPEKGWPVVFFIHGGFLQFGSPNEQSPAKLLGDTDFQCIFVMPAYRLNLLGFLASRELLQESGESHQVGNLGFWDQRLALEWTWKNISYFGGNSGNITIAGYSAGAYSTFMQLQYDLFQPEERSIVRRVLMLSNGPGMQPKSLQEAQDQFDELLEKLNIPLSLSPIDKLTRLRQTRPRDLIRASLRMELHEFRAVTDGEFVRSSLFHDIDNGGLATRMKQRGVKLMMGECKDEHWVYGTWHTPKDSLQSLLQRLQADYPRKACEALVRHYYPSERRPANCRDWCDAFGYIYADLQIHALERGLADALERHGAGHLVYRYRVEWRARCVDTWLPKEWGVTHTSDMSIWFWGHHGVLDEDEKMVAYNAFIQPLGRFINNQDISWGTHGIRELRTLTPHGTVAITADADWDRGQQVWKVLQQVAAALLAASSSTRSSL